MVRKLVCSEVNWKITLKNKQPNYVTFYLQLQYTFQIL